MENNKLYVTADMLNIRDGINGKIIDIEDKVSDTGLWKSHPNWKELRNEMAKFHFKEKG